MSFECPQTRFDEDFVYEDKDFTYQDHTSFQRVSTPFELIRASIIYPAYNDYQYPLYYRYMTTVCEYSRKSLTYEGDILNAFAGISRVLSVEMKSPFFYGHPVKFFDLSLLWEEYHDGNPTRIHGFPSWSWCGWKGRKFWDFNSIGNQKTWQEDFTLSFGKFPTTSAAQ